MQKRVINSRLQCFGFTISYNKHTIVHQQINATGFCALRLFPLRCFSAILQCPFPSVYDVQAS